MIDQIRSSKSKLLAGVSSRLYNAHECLLLWQLNGSVDAYNMATGCNYQETNRSIESYQIILYDYEKD